MSRAKRGFSIPLVAFALLINPLAGPAARGAEPSPLQPGARVRATLKSPAFGSVTDPKLIEGRLTVLTDTAIVVETSPGKPRVLPLDNLAGLERSLRPSRNGQGALIGLGVGAAVSAAFFLTAHDDGANDDSGDPYAELWDDLGRAVAVAFAVVFTGLTTLAGAIIAPGEKWERVPADQYRLANRFQPPPQVQAGFAPAPDGGGRFGVTVRF